MKNLTVFLFAVIMACSQLALADEQSKKEAEALLDSVGMEVMLEKSIEQMLQVQLQQNPALMPYKDVMRKFLAKNMSYESLKPDFINLYAEAFTAKELRNINAFYKTPTGKKAIALMPQLMGKGAQIGAARVQNNIGELQQMIQEESKKIEVQKSPAEKQDKTK